jgi:glycosyltransferase involved in cell wall biosynthesis
LQIPESSKHREEEEEEEEALTRRRQGLEPVNDSINQQLNIKESLLSVACTTVYDARDSSGFSGRVFEPLQAINRLVDTMYFLGPLPATGLTARILRAKAQYYRRIGDKTYYPLRDHLLARSHAVKLSRWLSEIKVDVVLSPMAGGSQPIAYLECKQPIVMWTDATFAGVVDFYAEYGQDKLCRETLRDAIENERAALNRASLLVYWSEWAGQSAIREYGIDPGKVRVISPGPACPAVFSSFDQARSIISARPKTRCRLLFVGMEWDRKGGNVALEVAKRLNAGGLETELSIVGSRPDSGDALPEFVQPIGYLDRRSRSAARTLNELFINSHFLILPSRAEAFGLVFSEASSFAVPSLATNVGGIPTAVRSGINGQTFSLEADPNEYCTYVSDMFADYRRYQELALSSFGEFKRRLNNEVAARTLVKAMAELV